MKGNEAKSLRRRILAVAAFCFFLFGVVLARGYQLQIYQGEELGARAERQLTKRISLPPIRGKIVDRNGVELATNREVSAVYAQPHKISDLDKTASQLAELLEEDKSKIKRKLLSKSSFVWLKRGIEAEAGKKISFFKIKGIGVISEKRRFYPNMELAGHLVGFAGIDSQGLEGIELKYNELIKGKPGYFIAERDALGRNIYPRGLNIKDSTSGGNVVLTIDKNIQHIAEREVGEALRKYKAKSGMALVMDPNTGEVLAMAVQPAFNPNFFRQSSPSMWRNRIVTDTFEPGSTFKIFLAATAIESGKVRPQDIFFCENGKFKLYKNTIHDSKEHGWLSVESILRVSSNIGAYKIAEKIGKSDYYRGIRGFGFGQKAGIDFPGERPGYIRAKKRISPIGFANLSFGQGLSVTAIQLVTAISAVANGGYVMKPYLVKKVVDDSGQTIFANFPTRVKRVISKETATAVTAILKRVISGEGTGVRAALEGYQVAGKTGTSQKFDNEMGEYSSDKHISSFIGYLPADDPKLAILVMLDEPKDSYYGGRVAAPVFKRIAEQALAWMQVAPKEGGRLMQAQLHPLSKSDVTGNEYSKSFAKNGDGKAIPDLRGLTLRETLVAMGDAPLRAEGNGVVLEQSPLPGELFSTKAGYSIRLSDRQQGGHAL
ncbi:MAG: penicillin-binding protein [Proteobacteria bacterium]|nr:penicillin-binding protein [Pseudomonadota bacterium]